MTFELPEKPKKTNTSADFASLRQAVDELDKFDYAWKSYANKADRKLSAANKTIKELTAKVMELENENTFLRDKHTQFGANGMAVVPITKPLPEVPQFVAEFIESYKDRRTIYGVFDKISKNRKTYPKLYEWVFEDENSQATFALAFITGKYQVEKPQLFYLRDELTGQFLAKDNQFKDRDRYFFGLEKTHLRILLAQRGN
ncbi:DUF1642 domain-containing protein [Lactococcus fujiensis]|uniref:Uncharacterized protein n=1 Tax=Lactococcus fujiensis JCM 16395 TaxID=1291764 RepID=A0A2A5RIQ1_9LACT|nr:DUF1642 domain-containing protein [Lactococcus fujiensis]PCR98930.1 hypothetical protein RT41_GL000618 [Lactococcus fujiensis JCM 16395]